MDRQETKRRLEERRERLKMEEKQKKELKKKQNKNRNSSGSSSSPTKYPHETKDSSSASEKDDVKRYETKRGDDDSGILILKLFIYEGETENLQAIKLVK